MVCNSGLFFYLMTKQFEIDKFQLLLKLTEVGLICIDEKLSISGLSPFIEEHFGLNKSDIGKPLDHYLADFNYPSLEKDVRKVLETRFSIQFDFPHNNGNYYSVEMFKAPIELDENGVVIRIKDISLTKQTEFRLTETKSMFESFMNVAPMLAWIKNDDLEYTYVNSAYMNIMGLKEEDFLGNNDFKFFSDEDSLMYRGSDRRVLKTGEIRSFPQKMKENGGERHFIIYKFPLIDVNRNPFVGGIALELTEQKLAEEEVRKINLELESRVTQRTEELSSANKELESFNYSISHDLRAPIRAIQSYSSLFIEEYGDKLNTEGKAMLSTIGESAIKMARLVDGLLNFSRLGKASLQLEEVNLDYLFEREIEKLKEDNPNIELKNFGCGLIEADLLLFEQVIFNLIGNAVKYSSGKKPQLIKIGINEQGEIYVEDNGVGFDTKYTSRLFGVFERAHKISEFDGTGVGLAIVKRIIEKHNGYIRAENISSGGARFSFKINVK